MADTTTSWTWQTVSRATGLTIALLLLVAYLVSFALGKPLDRPILLAFLAFATTLIGAPAGWQFVVRRSGDEPPR